MVKYLKKKTKTIEDQGEKQIRELEEHGKQLVKYNDEIEPSIHSKQKEIFEEFEKNGRNTKFK